jgi:hypothetical protein
VSKLKVFVSHSFDPDDDQLMDALLSLMSQPRFNLEILTARHAQARPMGQKIFELIASSDITIGIFTRKYSVVHSSEKLWIAPQYVVSECSYAQGLYRQDPMKGVHGFRERGVSPDRIGISTADGSEFPEFDRAAIIDGTGLKPLAVYIKDLTARYGERRRAAVETFSYSQRNVRKTVEVHRTGYGIFKNKVIITINNKELLEKNGNKIPHQVSLPDRLTKFPPLQQMLRGSVKDRATRPVLYCTLLKVAGRSEERPLAIVLDSQSSHLIRFYVVLPDKLKTHDVVEYQFVWSMPNVFCTFEDELKRTRRKYEEVRLTSRYGIIDEALLRVKFERETSHLCNPSIFGQRPFVTYAASADEESPTGEANPVTATEKDSVWEIFEQSTRRLSGAVIMKWCPVSKRHLRDKQVAAKSGAASSKPARTVKRKK